MPVITQTGICCALAALVAALYFRVCLRLAGILKRKFHLPTAGLAMLPLIALTVGLLYAEFLALQLWVPDWTGAIGGATLLGLAVGRVLPFPGAGSPMGFGFGDGDAADDGDGH